MMIIITIWQIQNDETKNFLWKSKPMDGKTSKRFPPTDFSKIFETETNRQIFLSIIRMINMNPSHRELTTKECYYQIDKAQISICNSQPIYKTMLIIYKIYTYQFSNWIQEIYTQISILKDDHWEREFVLINKRRSISWPISLFRNSQLLQLQI